MRWIPIVVYSICSVALLASAAVAEAQTTSAKPSAPQGVAHLTLPPVPRALLPDSFAGWVADGTPKTLPDAAQADAAGATALKEYDFTYGSTATYKRSGETLSLRALRFRDASGAYGAYSFYRQNGWPKEDVGRGAASNQNRVLFWQGNIVVNANFSRIGPMSGSEMRELAGQLPMIEGTRALAPPVVSSLPQAGLDGQTTHYALGLASYEGAGGVLPPDLVGFDRGAEAVTANYTLRSNPATLTIIDYPTPQMAMAQEGKIRAFLKAGAPKAGEAPWPKPLADSDQASLEVRRSGPLVAIVSGDAIPEESHKLLATVHYESDLTSIPQPTESEVSKTSKLLFGIVSLVIIGASTAILLGFFLGGGRALYRIARGKPVSAMYDTEFTSLHLED